MNAINLAEIYEATRALMEEFGLGANTSFVKLEVAKYSHLSGPTMSFVISVFTEGDNGIEQEYGPDWRESLAIIRHRLREGKAEPIKELGYVILPDEVKP